MPTEALMGIDIGTSSCKALLLDVDGTVLATASASYDVSIPQPGWSEQDPSIWVEATRRAVSDVLAQSPDADILAIGLSGQMHGLTALDRDHEVLRPAILWNDQRNAAECAFITEAVGGLDALLAATNNGMLPGYTGGKILWMRRNEPGLYGRLRHVLNPKDYLRFWLTGVLATEVSDASGTGLFDVRARRWSQPVLDAMALDADLLPPVFESHVISGRVSAEAAALFGLREGTPVAGGGGDAVIQTLGSGIIAPGLLQTTIGTAGIVACALDRPMDNPAGRLQVFCNVAPETWHCMGVSLNAGGALSWLRDMVRRMARLAGGDDVSFDRLVARAAESPAGSRGLLFLPYLNGERCPHPDPSARGSFIGLTSGHDDADLARSVLEGVVLSLRDIYELMAEAGIAANQIRTSGGGASSALWRQMQADIFGCDVLTTEGAAEGGALGAALIAGVGGGVWPDARTAAARLRVHERQAADPRVADLYQRLFAIYRGLYPALTASFELLAANALSKQDSTT